MKKLPRSQVEFELTISPEEVEKYFNDAAKHISEHVDIKGFRKGKIPADVLEKHVGKQAIFEEAGGFAIEEKYRDFVKNEKLSPVGYPDVKVKKMAEGNPIEVTIIVSVFPELTLGDYKKIKEAEAKKRNKDVKIDKKEIQGSLEYLQNSRAKETSVEREVKKGDIAEVDFEVRVDKVKIEGGDSRNHPVKIGDGKFIPGFEDELIGLKAGDKKEFSLTAPKDYFKKDLAGKKMDFSVKLNSVLEIEKPELNDDFAKSLGGFQTMAELEKNIEDGMKQEKEKKEKEDHINSVIDKIVKDSKVDLPDVMVEKELDKMMDEMKTNVEQHGINFDVYLQNLQKSIEDIRKEVREQAENRIKAALVLEEIAVKEDVKATDEELTEKTNQFLASYNNREEEKKINPEQMKAYAKMTIVNEKVLQFLEGDK